MAVRLTDLAETATVDGTVIDAPLPEAVVNRIQGTITWLPPAGSRVERGQPLDRIDDQPVVLMYGAMPMYRPLAIGASGPDVQQLQDNLVALGFMRSAAAAGTFGSVDAAGVRAWQASLGLATTGTVDLGRVVFVPSAVVIQSTTQQVGMVAGSSLPVQLGMPDLAVSARLAPAEAVPVVVGQAVQILTGGTTLAATTAAITGTPADATTVASGQSQGQDVLFTLSGAGKDPSLRAGTRVTVSIPRRTAKAALAVPTEALVVLSDGRYGVDVLQKDGAVQRRAVEVGIFDSATDLVQVSGGGLAAGDQVLVPTAR